MGNEGKYLATPKPKGAYIAAQASSVNFIPFRRPCPLCGDWLDCATHSHSEKHGMTLDEYLAKFKDKVTVNDAKMATIIPWEEGLTLRDIVLRSATSDEGITAYTLANGATVPYSTAIVVLEELVQEGFLVSSTARSVRKLGVLSSTRKEKIYFVAS